MEIDVKKQKVSELSYTDDQLVEGVRNREDDVFKFLENRFKPGIRLMVCNNSGTSYESEDLYSDAIVRLIEIVDRRGFKLDCQLPSLLYAICEKKWKLILKKKQIAENYHKRKLDTSPEEDFTDSIDKSLKSKILWESFEKLKDDCKRILRSYFQELSPENIAEILDYSYGYLRKRKCLCHKSLMKIVKSNPEYKQIKATDIP